MVSKFTSTALAALAVATAAPAQANDLRETLAADMPELMELYRDLHANPELSFEEHETAAKLAARMRALGFEVTEGVGRTGVVSVMRNGDGPTVLLRADMDG
ncbi:MAG: amidohydrolase, partial [Qipengyuania citrea]|nr:amidohydrolase [Qipengyuania citrea]